MHIIKLPQIWHIHTYLTLVQHGFELCVPVHTQICFQYICLLSRSARSQWIWRPTTSMNFGIYWGSWNQHPIDIEGGKGGQTFYGFSGLTPLMPTLFNDQQCMCIWNILYKIFTKANIQMFVSFLFYFCSII